MCTRKGMGRGNVCIYVCMDGMEWMDGWMGLVELKVLR